MFPLEDTETGLFGWLNTLKKSMLNRNTTFSVIFTENAWFCHGAKPDHVVRVTVPFASGTHTVLVSQNDDTFRVGRSVRRKGR